jgi:hypothetical protein
MVDDISGPEALNEAIGEAMQAYALVETTQASIIEALLKTDYQRAHAIFYTAQNVRSRNELIETLLELEFKDALRKFWVSCSKYLLTLSQFRNAIAHWHPHMNFYGSNGPETWRVRPALGHPVLSRNFDGIEKDDFPPFLRDCAYIREELSSLIEFVRELPATLPEKFRRPIGRRNEAVLRRRRKSTAQQPPRLPSRVSGLHKGRKPSARQRRERAVARAKKR